MIARNNPWPSVGGQCRLLSVLRSSFDDKPQGEPAMNPALMRLIDRKLLKTPFYAVPLMAWQLQLQLQNQACREP